MVRMWTLDSRKMGEKNQCKEQKLDYKPDMLKIHPWHFQVTRSWRRKFMNTPCTYGICSAQYIAKPQTSAARQLQSVEVT